MAGDVPFGLGYSVIVSKGILRANSPQCLCVVAFWVSTHLGEVIHRAEMSFYSFSRVQVVAIYPSNFYDGSTFGATGHISPSLHKIESCNGQCSLS